MAALSSLLLLVPVAGAISAEGVFTVKSIRIPPGTESRMAPLAAYVGNASWVTDLELDLPSATLSLYQKKFLRIPSPRGPVEVENVAGFRNQTWALRDATLRILGESGAPDEPRYLGLHPESGEMEIITDMGTVPASGAGYSFGSENLDRNAEPEYPAYFVRDLRPAILMKTSCLARYAGLGAIKLSGLQVEISSPGDAEPTVYSTGEFQTSPAEITVVYLYIRFNEPATLTFDTGPASLLVAAEQAQMTGEGRLSFLATAGELRAPKESHLPLGHGGEMVLGGSFNLGLTPLDSGKEARLTLSGDFEPQGLAFKPVPLAPGRLGASWFLVFGGALLAVTLVAGAAGGVGAGFALSRRVARVVPKPATLPFTADDCLATAHDALTYGDHPEALAWLRRAHALAPSSARICADLAFCLAEMGCRDDALAWYRKAHDLSADGEAALNAARVARDAGKDPTVVLGWLCAALDRAPRLVEEVAGEFPEVARLPGWAGVERRAWQRGGARGDEPA